MEQDKEHYSKAITNSDVLSKKVRPWCITAILGFALVAASWAIALIFAIFLKADSIAASYVAHAGGILSLIGLVICIAKRRASRGIAFAIAGLVLYAIMGGIALYAVMNIMERTDKVRVTTTKANLRLLHSAVNQLKMDTGRLPTEDEGLRVLIEPPTDAQNWQTRGYLKTTELPKDAWGHDFIYQLYPEGGKPFVIKSLGADGEDGGEGYDADLYSTDSE